MPHLEISALRPEKILDVTFGVFGEAQHEISLYLQLVDGLNGLMDLNKEDITGGHDTSQVESLFPGSLSFATILEASARAMEFPDVARSTRFLPG